MVVPLNKRPRSGPYSGINARSAKRFLTEQFKQAGLSMAEEDAGDLVMAVTGYTLTDFFIRGTEFLTPEQFDSIKSYADRRLAGEPVDSILGWREFFGRKFAISKDVLSPRGDTEVLVRCCLDMLASHEEPRLLDLGTGSGAIIISLLAEIPRATGQAVDISSVALEVAYQNAHQHNVSDRLTLLNGEWFDPVEGQFDLIVSNPPYIKDEAMKALERDVLDFDPEIALRGGKDGLDPYPVIISQSRDYLVSKGSLCVEIGFDQVAAVKCLFEAHSYGNVSIVKDLSGHDRCITGRLGPTEPSEI